MGEYGTAIELRMAGGAGPSDTNPNEQLDLAIAYHHAGQRDEARAWLERAHRSLESWHSAYANPRMEVEVLRHEAERLINGEREVHTGEHKNREI